jgi:hypothetical protein
MGSSRLKSFEQVQIFIVWKIFFNIPAQKFLDRSKAWLRGTLRGMLVRIVQSILGPALPPTEKFREISQNERWSPDGAQISQNRM